MFLNKEEFNEEDFSDSSDDDNDNVWLLFLCC